MVDVLVEKMLSDRRRGQSKTLVNNLRALLISCLLALLWLGIPGIALANDSIHVVQPGETLADIAGRLGTSEVVLRDLNGLASGEFAYEGMVLTVPGSGGAGADAGRGRASPAALGQHFSAVSFEQEVAPTEPLPSHEPAVASTAHANGQAFTVSSSGRRSRLTDAGTLVSGHSPVLTGQTGVVQEASEHPSPADPGKWIDLDLSEQKVVAYVGAKPIRTFIVSTGMANTPTVKGVFRIRVKTPKQDMSGGSEANGDYYYLEDVQWVQYFHAEYAFHGTYWHTNFGQPMSHGCVNMRNHDAKWLYDWASPTNSGDGWLYSSASNPGTVVVVHE